MEASKNTQPIDRPINGELPACLADASSSKKKRTNNRGKGGFDRVERLGDREKPRDTVGRGSKGREGRKKKVETKER